MHEYGFRMVGDDRGGFRFFRPDGEELTKVSAAPIAAPDAVGTLRAAHESAGVVINVDTNRSRWDGRRPDYHEAVGCLVAPPGAG